MAHSGLEKHGNRWRFRITIDGKRKWQSVPREHCRTKTAAGQWMSRFQGELQPVAPNSVRFKGFAEQWITLRHDRRGRPLKERTKEGYRAILASHLKPLHHVKVQEITVTHIRHILATMSADKRSGNTIRNAVNLLSAILGSAVSQNVLASNPVGKLDSNERPAATLRTFKRMLTGKEADWLLKKAGKYAPMIAVALMAGLRRGEILGLRWKDVDFETGTLRIRGDYKTAAAERNVELAPRLLAMLKAHRFASPYRGPDHYVFCTRSGTAYSPRNASRSFEQIVKDASLYDEEQPLTFHTLRHNYGSNLIAQGVDIVYVSAQMGHADPNVTMRVYAWEIKHYRNQGTAAEAIQRAFG